MHMRLVPSLLFFLDLKIFSQTLTNPEQRSRYEMEAEYQPRRHTPGRQQQYYHP